MTSSRREKLMRCCASTGLAYKLSENYGTTKIWINFYPYNLFLDFFLQKFFAKKFSAGKYFYRKQGNYLSVTENIAIFSEFSKKVYRAKAF
jgi:hypothetical protein